MLRWTGPFFRLQGAAAAHVVADHAVLASPMSLGRDISGVVWQQAPLEWT